MASCYVLDHVIQECLHEKAKVLNTARGKNTEAKIDIYAQSWIAVNAWIESRLAKQKGARISGFASFAWEMLEKDHETHCRPIFLLSDDFVKTHRVRRQRIHHIPQLTPVEEINYSSLAIRFSKVLTKDMIFSGLRDIFRKVGEFISRGYEIEIEFTFGVLRAKESRVKFVFNQARLVQILPETIEPGVYAHDDKPMRYIDQQLDDNETSNDSPRPSTSLGTARKTSSFSSSLSLPQLINTTQQAGGGGGGSSGSGRPPLIPSLQLSSTVPGVASGGLLSQSGQQSPSYDDNDDINDQSMVGGGAGGYSNTQDSLSYSRTFPTDDGDMNTNTQVAGGGGGGGAHSSSSSPSLDELMNMMVAYRHNKKAIRSQAKERVMAQAFQRCLEEVQHDAHQDDRQRYEQMKETEDWKTTTIQDREKMKSSVFELKKALDDQMEDNRKRFLARQQEKRDTVMKFILPETAGMAPSPLGSILDENGHVINSRQRIAKDLANQIQMNAETKEKTRKETQKKERDYMDRLSLERELHQVVERSRYLEKQKALVEAWERDGHIRNIRKLQPLGSELVQDYISKHLQDPVLTMTATVSNSLDQSLRQSIGYDPRKGKI
eukprot:gene5530-6089_t